MGVYLREREVVGDSWGEWRERKLIRMYYVREKSISDLKINILI